MDSEHTKFIWLRMGPSGRLLRKEFLAFKFMTTDGLLASYEGLCSVELVSDRVFLLLSCLFLHRHKVLPPPPLLLSQKLMTTYAMKPDVISLPSLYTFGTL